MSMKTFRAFCDFLEKLCLFVSSAALSLIVFSGTAEILARFFKGSSLQWVQEFIVLSLGISVFLAAPSVFRRNRDASLLLFREKLLPKTLQYFLDILLAVLTGIFLAAVFFFSVRLQLLQARASSAFLRIGMNWFSFPVSLFAAVTLIFSCERLALLLHGNEKEEGRT